MIDNLFVCIGAQKAGTSWLFKNLSKDTRFSYCPFVKEIHYFDYLYTKAPHLNRWRAAHLISMVKKHGLNLQPLLKSHLSQEKVLTKDLKNFDKPMVIKNRFELLTGQVNDEWYEKVLSIKSDTEFAMDITPDYAVISQDGFKHMSKISKNLKVLFILRNPVDRAWSGFLQGKKKYPGGVKAYLSENTINEDLLFKAMTSGKDIGARCDYISTLNALANAGITKEQLLIRSYDDISERPMKLVDEIYKFLSMEASKVVLNKELTEKVYSTDKVEMPVSLKVRLTQYYKPMTDIIYKKYGVDLT